MYSSIPSANILTSLLVAHGVTHVVVCPGSRNAALVHNFNECPDLTCVPATDERSAGFIALGLTQQTGRPAAVCVTSGSALLNVLPAAAEATYQHQGIIVISADRPAAWIGQLDGQTMPQPSALGSFVARSVSLPAVTDDESHWHCNRLVNEALIVACRRERPSVHINVPLAEPLFSFTTPELPEERRIFHIYSDDELLFDAFLSRLMAAKRPMVVIGQTDGRLIPDDYLAELMETHVVLYDCVSVDGMPPALTDDIIELLNKHSKRAQPDFVVYFGGNTVSKPLRQFLRDLPPETAVAMVTPSGELNDVSRHTRYVIEGDEYEVVKSVFMALFTTAPQPSYYQTWQDLREHAEDDLDAQCQAYSPRLAVKLLEEQLADSEAPVYYANSTVVRLANEYARHHCRCNRGLNGIEGSISTAVGAALGADPLPAPPGGECPDTDEVPTLQHSPSGGAGRGSWESGDGTLVYCVTGDLSFFYDSNALWNNAPANLRILLTTDGGGGISSRLPGPSSSPAPATFVCGRHTRTAEHLCRDHGLTYLRATDEASLRKGIKALHSPDGTAPILLEVII